MTDAEGCKRVENLGDLLLDRARVKDLGYMVEIHKLLPVGIMWKDSLGDHWIFNLDDCKQLILGWDGKSEVHWFTTMHYSNGEVLKTVVIVEPAKMQRIALHLYSLLT